MKKKKLGKVIASLALSLSMTFALVGCAGQGGGKAQDPESVGTGQGVTDPSAIKAKRGSVMAMTDDGAVKVSRVKKGKTQSMGEEGTWTIFVYLCGSDLESGGGCASRDMIEMAEGTENGGMKFVVQTGGASDWAWEDADPGKLSRFVIQNGEIEHVEDAPLASMGESSTLADFLKWGVKNYPAANMGMILWDHGGGSIAGVCFDELFNNDSLSLGEIDSALSDVYGEMTDNFEFMGFDACLMGAIECAHVLANYANYMYASEEVEPGSGWDYVTIGSFLSENGDADGAQLGKVTCDSFYESCAAEGEEADCTLSVIDLSALDSFLEEFNNFAVKLYENTDGKDNTEMLSKVARAINSSANYGGNTPNEGYTNMVDLGDMIKNAGSVFGDDSDAASVLDSIVVYMRNGKNKQGATGLSTYYPLQIEGSEELSTFGSSAISPYYFDFVSRAAYANANSGNTDGYSDSEYLDLWQSSQTQDAGEVTAFDDAYDYYDSFEQTGHSGNITFDREPSFDENGNFSFRLSEEGIMNALEIEGNVFMLDREENCLVEYGVTADLNIDWDTGEVKDNFDGYWFSLPDGQNLTVEIQSQEDGYDIYAAPVMLNGERTNLLFIHDYEAGEAYIYAVWDGISDSGAAARNMKKLKNGDVIIPISDAVSLEQGNDEEIVYEGEEYIYNGNDELIYALMPDGEYAFSYTIYDIYGDYYDTENVSFTIEGRDVFYSLS